MRSVTNVMPSWTILQGGRCNTVAFTGRNCPSALNRTAIVARQCPTLPRSNSCGRISLWLAANNQQPASHSQEQRVDACHWGFKHALLPRKNFQMSVRWLGRGFCWRSSSTKQLSKERHFPFYDHRSVKRRAEAAIALAMSAAAHLIEHHNGGCYLGAITESPVCRGIGASAIGPRKLVRLGDGW